MRKETKIGIVILGSTIGIITILLIAASANSTTTQITCPTATEQQIQKCYKPYGTTDYFNAYYCTNAACQTIDENVATKPPCALEMTINCEKSGKIPIPDILECTEFKTNKQKILDCLEETT